MKLITQFELKSKTKAELRGLYSHAFNEAVKADSGSHKRRNALASIENISRELATRHEL
jgi:hypothetical protein